MLSILKQCSACSLHSFGVLRMKQQRADAARVPKEKPRTLARLMDGGPLRHSSWGKYTAIVLVIQLGVAEARSHVLRQINRCFLANHSGRETSAIPSPTPSM